MANRIRSVCDGPDQVGQWYARQECPVINLLEPGPGLARLRDPERGTPSFRVELHQRAIGRERAAPGLNAPGQTGDEHLATTSKRVTKPRIRTLVPLTSLKGPGDHLV